MTCVSFHRCLGLSVVRKKEFRLKGFISLEEINLSRQKENYRFYLFDKSWYFPAKHVLFFNHILFSWGMCIDLFLYTDKIPNPMGLWPFSQNR